MTTGARRTPRPAGRASCPSPLRPDLNRPLVKIIACQVVFDELPPEITRSVPCSVLEYGLHVRPEKLHQEIQKEIDRTEGQGGVIFLGYGLCARAATGLTSSGHWLAIPNFHDCIGIFLGPGNGNKNRAAGEVGTYYLTRGWIEAGDEPLGGLDKLAEQYGPERAANLMKVMLKNYTRLLFLRTGDGDLERYREYARNMAEKYGLRFEEEQGTNEVIQKAAEQNWDHDFIMVPPGETISLSAFLNKC